MELGLDFYQMVPRNARSQLPEAGPCGVLPMTEHFVEVDHPPEEEDVGYPGPALMHVTLWLPDVPEGEVVPVIAMIHPYYEFGIPDTKSDSNTIPDLGVGR